MVTQIRRPRSEYSPPW